MPNEFVDNEFEVWVYNAANPNGRPKKVRPEQVGRAVEAGWLPLNRQYDEPTAMQALARGATQGVTAKFADEIAGAAAGSGGRFTGLGPGVDAAARRPSNPAAATSARDAYRAEDERIRGAQPGPFLAGEVGGAMATSLVAPNPSSLLGAVGQGAAFGALQGAGGAQELEDVPLDATVGGLTGGFGGALGYGAGQALTKVTQASGRAAQDALPKAVEKADEMRVLTSMGATGGTIAKPAILQEAERFPGGVHALAEQMRATPGVAPTLGTTRSIGNAAEGAAIRSRDAIQGVLGKVDAAGERVDVKAFAQTLRMEAIDLATRRPEMATAARALLKRADDYEALYPNGATMVEAQTLKNDLGNIVNWTRMASGAPIPGGQDAAATATRALTREMDEATRRALGPDAVKAYQGARRTNQAMRMVGDAAEESVGRAGKNNLFPASTLPTAALAAVGGSLANGATTGGAAGAAVVGGALAHKVGQLYGSTARASLAEGTAKALQLMGDPRVVAALGDTGQRLAQAAARGSQDFAREWALAKIVDPRVQTLDARLTPKMTPAGEADLRRAAALEAARTR